MIDRLLSDVVDDFLAVAEAPDAPSRIEARMAARVADRDVAEALARRSGLTAPHDLAIHRSESLTVIATSMPPGFRSAPHDHNLWSVVGVCRGQEDNEFFAREGNRLVSTGTVSIVGPGLLANAPDVIHAIRNPRNEPLLALHAYGGDLFTTARSSWDPDTHEERPYDWRELRVRRSSRSRGRGVRP